MGDVNLAFQLTLEEFPFDRIREGFIRYLQAHSEFPTPADIVLSIRRQGRPRFSEAVYLHLRRKPPATLTEDEQRYLAEYEHYVLTGEMVVYRARDLAAEQEERLAYYEGRGA